MTMTDITDPQVLSIIDTLRQLADQVKVIDSELGTEASGPVAARNKVANEWVTKHNISNVVEGAETNPVVKLVSQVVNALKSPAFSNDEILVATYTELSNQMSKNFGEKVKNVLQAVVDAQPKATAPTITDSRKTELASERSNLTNLFKLQKEMLKYISNVPVQLPSDIEEPVARRGSIGPRGAKFTKDYQLYFDGKLQQLTDSDGDKSNATLSNLVVKTKEAGLSSTKELRDFIIEQLGVTPSADGKTVELPDTWEVTIGAPVSKTLKGVATTAVSVDESEDDEDDTTNGDTDSPEDAFASA